MYNRANVKNEHRNREKSFTTLQLCISEKMQQILI